MSPASYRNELEKGSDLTMVVLRFGLNNITIFTVSCRGPQGNRQGMDMGTEYRSIVLCEDEEQLQVARASKEAQQVK